MPLYPRLLSALAFSLAWMACVNVASAAAQDQPTDPAEIARNLLYQPARRIEASNGTLFFRAADFTYRFNPSGEWQVAREKNELSNGLRSGLRWKEYTCARLRLTFRFTGVATDDEAFLEIRRVGPNGPQAEPLARLRLWERKQLATVWLRFVRQDSPGQTARGLERDLEIADPDVAEVADDGSALWLALRYSGGGGALGLGSLVRFDPNTNDASLVQPGELAFSAVSHIAAAGGTLWLGAERLAEGAVEPTVRLARFKPDSNDLRSFPPLSDVIPGSIVTALHVEAGALWVATDAGICRAGSSEEEWTCWRMVPTVRVVAPVPMGNRPGAPPRRQLPAGSYEVLWASPLFLEVVSPDAMEGWMADDDLTDYVNQRFQADAYELGNVSAGGVAPMRLLDRPEGDPLAGAQVYRAPLEPISQSAANGWQRVRAKVGWISRQNLEVVPVMQPVVKMGKID
jgi:hypothetical protein